MKTNNASSQKFTKNRIPGPGWHHGCVWLWLRAGSAILGSVLRECFLGEETFEQIPGRGEEGTHRLPEENEMPAQSETGLCLAHGMNSDTRQLKLDL